MGSGRRVAAALVGLLEAAPLGPGAGLELLALGLGMAVFGMAVTSLVPLQDWSLELLPFLVPRGD